MNLSIYRAKLILIAIFTISGLLLVTENISASDKTLYEKTFSTVIGDELEVSVSAGEIIVSSWDRNEVSVTVIGDEDINDYLEFFFEKTDDGVEVKTEKISSWSSWSRTPKYKVKVVVPQKYDAKLKTSGGDIELTALDGDLQLATSGGDISVIDSKGNLLAKTSGGDVESVNFNGISEMKTSGSNIDVQNNTGSVEVKTSGGDIKLMVTNGEVIGSTSGGDIELVYTGKNEGIELSTSGGDIELKLPSDFSANVILQTSGGKAKCNYSPVKVEEISRSKFYGKLNNGGAEVICKTSGGHILVENK